MNGAVWGKRRENIICFILSGEIWFGGSGIYSPLRPLPHFFCFHPTDLFFFWGGGRSLLTFLVVSDIFPMQAGWNIFVTLCDNIYIYILGGEKFGTGKGRFLVSLHAY
ncbi:hypothetical protein, unlikely [Trypanosoma brucei gambiense DAL972]|uniref:Uncharacterized protein n=1 Tax=Trypanosoma brucei gambiense (strain MHOM/CI/86/DAL972) TaxID=679716 RepID=C9ZVC9_TRYB9|nr:hypothetical protein, unlikely [Trypanosoma brucei gambiense DAL972]CBH13367.1 hypothetical protein, unlikely [Trypanosoma brucei gambiense DAL972]|eukprot:XP_011775644.1 hypothetical protein, unlikely [Trypanosoma brucei gambiense DAL972]